MGRQDVAAEVAVVVAPHRVDVVVVVLRVVVLDGEVGALHAVVVRAALFGDAHPRELDRVDAVLLDRRDAGLAERGGLREGVFLDQLPQRLLLTRRQRAVGDADVGQPLGLPLVHREDVVRRLRIDHRRLALRRVERLQQRAGEILLGGEGARAGLRAGPHLGRVAAEELRARGDRRAAHDRPVLRDVVPFEAPAPRFGGRRRAEDGEQVSLRIAVRVPVAADERLLAGVAFDVVEHRLERADRLDLGEALGAEAGLEQLHRGGALRVGHREVGEALARHRREEPVLALLAREREGRGGLLPGVQRRQEGRGGVAHRLGRRRLAGAAGRREREHEADGERGEDGTHERPGSTLRQCGHEGLTLLRTVVDSPLREGRSAPALQAELPTAARCCRLVVLPT